MEPLDMEPNHEPIIVVNILKKFTNVISSKLLKTLSPHRGMDHHIELE